VEEKEEEEEESGFWTRSGATKSACLRIKEALKGQLPRLVVVLEDDDDDDDDDDDADDDDGRLAVA